MNKLFLVAVAVAFTFASCSKSDGGEQERTISKQIAGHIEKGPFVQGSEVTLTDLNKDLSQSGKSFTTNTFSDLGSFDFGQTLELSSGIVELKTSGYFYNECTGKLSSSQITLKAIANANETKNLNVNLLTHLEYNRVKHLVKNGVSFSAAKEQAEREILRTFAITDQMSSPEKVSLTDNNKDASILLAISSIMLYDKSEAEFSEFIAKFSSDLEGDGSIDDSSILDKIKAGQEHCHPSTIIQTMEAFYKGKGSDITIGDFSLFVDFNGDGVIDEKDQEILEKVPNVEYQEEYFYSSEDAVKSALSGIYAKVRDYIKLQNSLDVMRLNNKELGLLTPYYSLVKNAWTTGYSSVNYALQFIQGLERVGNTTFDKDSYLATANALRAFVMYHIASQWGNVPILTQVSTDDISVFNLVPSSAEEQYKYALGLIENLKVELDNSLIESQQRKYYFTQNAVCVLKAEIYLALDMKDKAKSVLQDVADEDVFALFNDGEQSDIEMYSAEYIAYLREEANGTDNSEKWYANRKGYCGTFAALKRLGKVQSLTGIDAHYNLLPIPASELSLNPNLSQNSGY